MLYLSIFQKSVEKVQVSLKYDNKNGTLHEADRHTVLIITRSNVLRMRNVSDKRCRENQNTHIVFNIFLEGRTVYEIMW